MVAARDVRPDDEPLAPVRRRLAELANLQPDWNSYGACPPTPAAIDGVLRFVSDVERLFWRAAGERVQPTSISPLPSGGIELEWQNPVALIAVDIGPDGRLGYLRKIGSGQDAEYLEEDDVSRETLLPLIAEVLLPRS